MTTSQFQRRLIELGYPVGTSGSTGKGDDGTFGEESFKALNLDFSQAFSEIVCNPFPARVTTTFFKKQTVFLQSFAGLGHQMDRARITGIGRKTGETSGIKLRCS